MFVGNFRRSVRNADTVVTKQGSKSAAEAFALMTAGRRRRCGFLIIQEFIQIIIYQHAINSFSLFKTSPVRLIYACEPGHLKS